MASGRRESGQEIGWRGLGHHLGPDLGWKIRACNPGHRPVVVATHPDAEDHVAGEAHEPGIPAVLRRSGLAHDLAVRQGGLPTRTVADDIGEHGPQLMRNVRIDDLGPAVTMLIENIGACIGYPLDTEIRPANAAGGEGLVGAP